MKFLVVGDLHLWDGQVKVRLDNFRDVCLNKLRYIVEKYANNGYDFIMFLGDFFDQPIQSKTFLNEVVTILLKVKVPIFFITGNHTGDVSYKDSSTYTRKDLGLLEVCGIMSKLSSQVDRCFGLSAYEDYIEKSKSVDVNSIEVLFCHHFIESGWDDLTLKVEDLKLTFPKLKYIFAGHDHQFHGAKKIKDVVVVRSGSILRLTRAKESQRSIVVSEFDNGIINFLPVQSEDFHNVFRVEAKGLSDQVDKSTDCFVNDIKDMKVSNIDLNQYLFESLKGIKEVVVQDYVGNMLRGLGFLKN